MGTGGGQPAHTQDPLPVPGGIFQPLDVETPVLSPSVNRTASGNLAPGENTNFTGASANQTLTLPGVGGVDGTVNAVQNESSVNVTVTSSVPIDHYGTVFGAFGSLILPPGMAVILVYDATNAEWHVVSGGFTLGFLVARKSYAPTTRSLITPSSGNFAALDTTNLAVSVVAPPNGNLLAKLTACLGAGLPASGGAASTAVFNAIIDNTGAVWGPTALAMFITKTLSVAESWFVSTTTEHLITGLIPGTVYTMQWNAAAALAGGSSAQYAVSNPQGSHAGAPSTVQQGAPAVMEFLAA